MNNFGKLYAKGGGETGTNNNTNNKNNGCEKHLRDESLSQSIILRMIQRNNVAVFFTTSIN